MNETPLTIPELLATIGVVTGLILTVVVVGYRRFRRWGKKDERQSRIVRDINRK